MIRGIDKRFKGITTALEGFLCVRCQKDLGKVVVDFDASPYPVIIQQLLTCSCGAAYRLAVDEFTATYTAELETEFALLAGEEYGYEHRN